MERTLRRFLMGFSQHHKNITTGGIMLYRTAPVFGLRREIDKLFEDAFGGATDGGFWNPAVDIRENDNELRIDVELPGINPDEVEVTAENGVLTVRGEKRGERKEEDKTRYHVVERSYGSFMRSFQLPQGLDEDRIEASFDNGILSVHIPKSALPQPRRIQITPAATQKAVGTGMTSGQALKSSSENAAGSTSTAKQSNTRNRETSGTNA